MSKALECIDSVTLMVEVSRRGLLNELHGAVGALYDNLAANGVLDGETSTACYLAYRLRREDAKLASVNGDSSTPVFWQQKIDAMDADLEVERATDLAIPEGIA